MTGTFFLSWELWLQMTFVLLGALILTIGAGLMKNIYHWRRSRNYAKLSSKASASNAWVAQDIEARAMAEIDSIPFGIKALQSGIQIEGIWISQPTTPIQTPTPGSPVLSARPSPVPSLIGGLSSSSTPSGAISPPELLNNEYTLSRIDRAKATRIPSFTLDASQTTFSDQDSHIYDHMSTLEALEGRSFSQDDIQRQHLRNSRQTYSGMHSVQSGGSSTRDCSPSPPGLTDGTSQTDTPTSLSVRPHLSAYLSESNHRMSHVAETGQIHPRVRLPKMFDNMTLSDSASSLRSASRTPQTMSSIRTPSRVSSTPSISPPTQSDFSEIQSNHLHVPKPAILVRRPSLDLHSVHTDTSRPGVMPQRHTRAFVSSQVIAGQQPSPVLVEYMSRSFTDGSVPLVRDFTARHTIHNGSPSCSSCHQQLPPTYVPPPPSIPSQFRKVNDSFEVGRGSVGLSTTGMDLPSLEPSVTIRTDKRKSKKLQKKQPRASSIG